MRTTIKRMGHAIAGGNLYIRKVNTLYFGYDH